MTNEEDEDEDEGKDKEAVLDNDLEQYSKYVLSDSELHESEIIIIPTVSYDIISSAVAEKCLDEKDNEDQKQDYRDP